MKGRFLHIEGLTEGSYILKLLSLEHEIKITIIQGNQWEQPNQIYNEK